MTETLPDVLAETRMSVSQVAAKVSGQKGAPASTQRKVRRWIEAGVKIRGSFVKLQAVRVGYLYVTSEEALARFMEACFERPALDCRPADRTPAQARRDSEKADREITKLLQGN